MLRAWNTYVHQNINLQYNCGFTKIWTTLYNINIKTFKYSKICSQIILFGLKMPRVFSMDKTVPYSQKCVYRLVWAGFSAVPTFKMWHTIHCTKYKH